MRWLLWLSIWGSVCGARSHEHLPLARMASRRQHEPNRCAPTDPLKAEDEGMPSTAIQEISLLKELKSSTPR